MGQFCKGAWKHVKSQAVKCIALDDAKDFIEPLIAENRELVTAIKQVRTENNQLKAQVEKMKCCQNCKRFLVNYKAGDPCCKTDVCYPGHRINWEGK
jgi:hypothetical protein